MDKTASHLIIHVPHASTVIPDEVRYQFSISDAELRSELLALTDWYTDDLFFVPEACGTTIDFPISRFVVDPERFENDDDEVMAARGMGVIYSRGSTGRPIRHPLTPDERESLLAGWYRPHWSRLNDTVEAALRHHGRCLIIDAHSFPDRPLPVHAGQYGTSRTSDICLGTSPVHTSSALLETACAEFESHGLTVSIDTPFQGTIVPTRHLGTNPHVQSIMIEVNRRLYMDEETGRKSSSYQQTKSAVNAALLRLFNTESP